MKSAYSIFMPGESCAFFTTPCGRASVFKSDGVFSSPTITTQTVKRNGMPPLAPGYSARTIADELVFDGMKLISRIIGLWPRAMACAWYMLTDNRYLFPIKIA
jgi:hypothetical protein